jgi:hypothetical protein
MKALACLLFISLVWAARAQEQESRREGVITGRVVAADGQPLTGLRVMAVAVGKASAIWTPPQPITCDAEGNFKVTGLAHGVYKLIAMAPGYITAPNQSRNYRIGENVTLLLVKGGVITGRVTDEFGEPMIGVRVSAESLRDSEGQTVNGAGSLNAGDASRLTDDRGVYRLFGLEAGAYMVGINGSGPMFANPGRGRREPPTYSPSSPRASAAEVNLRGSEEVAGVDIRARAARGRSISGTISGDTQGEGLFNGVSVMLYSAADKSLAGSTVVVNSQSFSLHGVDDGEYLLGAVRFNESMEFSYSAPRRVTVKGADLRGIDLKLLKLGSISGRVVIDALESATNAPSKPESACKSAEQFTVEEVLIEAKRDERTPTSLLSEMISIQPGVTVDAAAPEKDGGFTLKSLDAGRHWIIPELPDETWYVRAMTQTTSASPKPIDLARQGVTIKQGEKLSGVEIRIAPDAASLGGKIVPAREAASKEGPQPPKRLRVYLVPAETTATDDLLRYAETAVQSDGSFEFKHIAPGKYLLHGRQLADKVGNDDPNRPAAWDTTERAKLRREAEAAKNEIDLKPCQRVKDQVLRR